MILSSTSSGVSGVLVTNNYSVYSLDIEPKGFKVIEFDDDISEEVIQHAAGTHKSLRAARDVES